MKPQSSASEKDAYGYALLEILEQRAKFGYRNETIQKFMIKKSEPEERLAFAKRLYQAMSTNSFASLDHQIRNDRFMQARDCKTRINEQNDSKISDTEIVDSSKASTIIPCGNCQSILKLGASTQERTL